MFSTVCSYNTRGDVFVYFKYFKPPLINASSINTCEKKQKQQQKRMCQDRAERIVNGKVCKREKENK